MPDVIRYITESKTKVRECEIHIVRYNFCGFKGAAWKAHIRQIRRYSHLYDFYADCVFVTQSTIILQLTGFSQSQDVQVSLKYFNVCEAMNNQQGQNQLQSSICVSLFPWCCQNGSISKVSLSDHLCFLHTEPWGADGVTVPSQGWRMDKEQEKCPAKCLLQFRSRA